MLRVVLGMFMILHGGVHLLYLGQSARFFELQPGMVWPDGAWSFSTFLEQQAIRNLANIACIVAAIGFAIGGAGILATQSWWRTAIVASAAFSAVFYVLFWDGKAQGLDNKGGIGILINLAIIATLLIVKWPPADF